MTTGWAAGIALAGSLLFAVSGGALIDLLTVDPTVRALAREYLPWAALAPLAGVWAFSSTASSSAPPARPHAQRHADVACHFSGRVVGARPIPQPWAMGSAVHPLHCAHRNPADLLSGFGSLGSRVRAFLMQSPRHDRAVRRSFAQSADSSNILSGNGVRVDVQGGDATQLAAMARIVERRARCIVARLSQITRSPSRQAWR